MQLGRLLVRGPGKRRGRRCRARWRRWRWGGTPPGAPSAPTVLTGRSLAQLIWPATAGASSYCIYRNGTFVNSVTGALYYIDEGLVLGSSYSYELSAANTAGESGKSLPVAAATAIWTKIICSSAIDFASGIALDGDGNFYVTGYTTGNLDGQTNAGLKDIFVTKYDQTGTKQWTRLLGTASDDAAGGIAVDASGNVYVTGYTNGSLAGQTNAGGADVFVAKYDGSGARIWVALLGTSADDAGNGIAADSSGNVYVTGYTQGNLGGQTNAGGADVFIAKYDTSGAKQWVALLGTSADDAGNGIAADGSGNLYITGYTAGNLAGQTNAGGKDIFFAAYDASGNRQWVALLGTAADDVGNGIALGPSGALCAVGVTAGNLDGQTNAGATDAFLTMFNTSGAKQWTRLFGTSQTDAANAVAFDASGNCYVTGYTYGNLNSLYGRMGGGAGGGSQTNAGNDDVFIAKYDTSGTNQWAGLLGTPANDSGAAITVDQYGNSYIAGSTGGSLDGITNTDSSGAFVAKTTSDGDLW